MANMLICQYNYITLQQIFRYNFVIHRKRKEIIERVLQWCCAVRNNIVIISSSGALFLHIEISLSMYITTTEQKMKQRKQKQQDLNILLAISSCATLHVSRFQVIMERHLCHIVI